MISIHNVLHTFILYGDNNRKNNTNVSNVRTCVQRMIANHGNDDGFVWPLVSLFLNVKFFTQLILNI